MSLRYDAINIVLNYLYASSEEMFVSRISNELCEMCKVPNDSLSIRPSMAKSYSETQKVLSVLNEQESIRKAKGVYYTPSDVVAFIAKSCVRLAYGELADDIATTDLGTIPCEDFCKKKIVFDPTCGAGEFLLAILNIKFNEWDKSFGKINKVDISKIVSTIRGNDINEDSVIISKLRIYMLAVHRYGVEKCLGLSTVLDKCFSTNDYVVNPPSLEKTYDIVIGNPPYVEDRKSGLDLKVRYGNIYANVLVNAARNLKTNGVFGFVIPLSYVSTPRMKKLRDDLLGIVSEQYILNYADRPDCLFSSVHQKLSILICKSGQSTQKIMTSNYRCWYKEERQALFLKAEVIQNEFISDKYIPKLGNQLDVSIYKKVTERFGRKSLLDFMDSAGEPVYVNMRAAFWIKAFRNEHLGSGYKRFLFENEGKADYFFCLLNSSLFWWFWIVVSDCWHITKKELENFMIVEVTDYSNARKLAKALEKKLEKTKVYVGTVQTEYEYKHKSCIQEIQNIDNYINELYGLSNVESEYIKSFAFKYRVSGGVAK